MNFCWIPTNDEKRYLDLIASMTVDCLLGKGTVNRRTYTDNLRTCANQLDELQTVEAPSKGAQGGQETRKRDDL